MRDMCGCLFAKPCFEYQVVFELLWSQTHGLEASRIPASAFGFEDL